MDQRIYCSLPQLLALRHQAHGFHFLAKQASKSLLSGRKQSTLRGRGLDFVELRHYVQGDDIRAIDWRVSNRTGKAHVRVTAEEKDRNVLLVIDQRQRLFFASQGSMKSVMAAQLAALCAWRSLNMGDRIGAVLFNDKRIEEYKPSRSETALLAWFTRLVAMNTALNSAAQPDSSMSFEQVLQRVQRLAGHDYLIVVVSDFSDCNDAAIASLKHLSQHNDVIAAIVRDPLEAQPSLASNTVVSDGRHQFTIDSSDTALYGQYQPAYKQQLAELQTRLRQVQIPIIPITTAEPIMAQLQAVWGAA